MLGTKRFRFSLSFNPLKVRGGIITHAPILLMRKLKPRHREVNKLSQGHTVTLFLRVECKCRTLEDPALE